MAAYDARMLSYAAFSGRGFAGKEWTAKPDLAAPGVAVTSVKQEADMEVLPVLPLPHHLSPDLQR